MYSYIPPMALDYTGSNPDNLVSNEPVRVGQGKVNRAVVLSRGLYYSYSLVLFDKSYQLVRNKDFIEIEMHEESSERSGLEVNTAIVITNKAIGNNLTATYQAVGGPYDRNNLAIQNLYNSIINDTRLVHWDNISFKPNEFAPTPHNHSLNDIRNWTPMIHQLERVVMAIEYASIDLNKKIISNVVGDFKCDQLEMNLPTSNVVKHDALLYKLSQQKLLSPLSVSTKLCYWELGTMAHFDIDTTSLTSGGSQSPAINQKIYWSLYKENNERINSPLEKNGIVHSNGGIVRVYVYVPVTHMDETETLYIGVKTDNGRPDFDAVSYKIQFRSPLFANMIYPTMVFNSGYDTDSKSIPALYNTNDYNRINDVLDNMTMIDSYSY